MSNSILSCSEAEQLTESINKAFENATIAEWFSDKWEQTYSENDIILPIREIEKAKEEAQKRGEKEKLTRRPDRVMINGNRVVVVDYKFGHKQTSNHRNQIIRYTELLREMGYTDIEGYLWYVNMGLCSKVV
jgi:ATP-dependent exoDNAse (exonuclease V) beta subunit